MFLSGMKGGTRDDHKRGLGTLPTGTSLPITAIVAYKIV